MRRFKVIGVIPGGDEGARRRAEACAAFAAERGQRLILAEEKALTDETAARSDEPAADADGFLIFLPEGADPCEAGCLKRRLKERYPRAEIRCLRPHAGERETAAVYLAYWPSRAAIDEIRRNSDV